MEGSKEPRRRVILCRDGDENRDGVREKQNGCGSRSWLELRCKEREHARDGVGYKGRSGERGREGGGTEGRREGRGIQ